MTFQPFITKPFPEEVDNGEYQYHGVVKQPPCRPGMCEGYGYTGGQVTRDVNLHPGENFRYEIAVDYGLSFKLQEIHIYFGDVFAGAYLINVFLESENVNTDFMIKNVGA